MPTLEEPQLAHCARCRRLYVRHKWNVCDSCLPMEEADYARIREVLADNPGISAEKLAEQAHVNVACVLRMLDEGLIANGLEHDATCGRCGAPAISPRQRLCANCLMDLDRRISVELSEAKLAKRAQEMKGKAQRILEFLNLRRRE